MTLAYLDECGFSPSQPVTSSWAAAGTRKRMPYENPCGRRVNALGILIPEGPEPMLLWDSAPRSLTSHDLLALLPEVPRRTERLVVVLDNGSIHTSRVLKDALPTLQQQGIDLYYLPPYSPELNAIEAVFGGIKRHGLPERRYTSIPALLEAIDTAFAEAEARLLAKHHSQHQLSPVA